MNRRFQAAVGFAVLFGVLVGTSVGGGSAEASSKARVTLRAYVDCEDVQRTPCVTIDEGTWRLVRDYTPYKATKLKECKVISIKKANCVLPHKTKRGLFWVALKG
jgi:hypothetical protein